MKKDIQNRKLVGPSSRAHAAKALPNYPNAWITQRFSALLVEFKLRRLEFPKIEKLMRGFMGRNSNVFAIFEDILLPIPAHYN